MKFYHSFFLGGIGLELTLLADDPNLTYIGWGFIALAIIGDQFASRPIRGRMTPEKAQRIKPYAELPERCRAAKDIEGYDSCLQDIRRIEDEPA